MLTNHTIYVLHQDFKLISKVRMKQTLKLNLWFPMAQLLKILHRCCWNLFLQDMEICAPLSNQVADGGEYSIDTILLYTYYLLKCLLVSQKRLPWVCFCLIPLHVCLCTCVLNCWSFINLASSRWSLPKSQQVRDSLLWSLLGKDKLILFNIYGVGPRTK